MKSACAALAVLSSIGLVHSLAAAQSTALRYTVRDAIGATKADDCARLGAMVNDEMDTNPAMQLVAGVIHEEGYCVDRSDERARRYYEAGLSKADLGSLVDLGLAYAQGEGLPKSYSKAGAWLAEAARRNGNSRLPRVASIPAGPPTPETEWNGYLMSISYVANRLIRYPKDALVSKMEGTVLAKVCLNYGTVQVSTSDVKVDPVSGATSIERRNQMGRAVEDGFQRAIQVMKKPAVAPARNDCFEQPVRFRIR